jgi:hypothetical protein
VRFLSCDRLQQDAVVRRPRLRTQELVALPVATHSRGESTHVEDRTRRGRALKREQRRSNEELAANEGGDGISGKPEHKRWPANPEGERLAGLDRDAPEHLLDAELRENPAHQIVRSDGDTT